MNFQIYAARNDDADLNIVRKVENATRLDGRRGRRQRHRLLAPIPKSLRRNRLAHHLANDVSRAVAMTARVERLDGDELRSNSSHFPIGEILGIRRNDDRFAGTVSRTIDGRAQFDRSRFAAQAAEVLIVLASHGDEQRWLIHVDVFDDGERPLRFVIEFPRPIHLSGHVVPNVPVVRFERGRQGRR